MTISNSFVTSTRGASLARYVFPAVPEITYDAYVQDDTVTLVYYFLVVTLSSAEFNGLLSIGKLDRSF